MCCVFHRQRRLEKCDAGAGGPVEVRFIRIFLNPGFRVKA